MKINSIQLGQLGANCYIIETEKGNAVAVDVGGEAQRVLNYLNENNLTLKKILLTHGHFDHIGGVSDVQQATNAEVFIHAGDVEMLSSSVKNLGDFIGAENFQDINNYITINDSDAVIQDELKFRVIYTPGHTDGSVCYICEDSIFSGDTLFRCSIGRTDFPGGSFEKIRKSLKKLYDLNDEYNIYPGHETVTTLNYEKKNNPYMKENPYDDFI